MSTGCLHHLFPNKCRCLPSVFKFAGATVSHGRHWRLTQPADSQWGLLKPGRATLSEAKSLASKRQLCVTMPTCKGEVQAVGTTQAPGVDVHDHCCRHVAQELGQSARHDGRTTSLAAGTHHDGVGGADLQAAGSINMCAVVGLLPHYHSIPGHSTVGCSTPSSGKLQRGWLWSTHEVTGQLLSAQRGSTALLRTLPGARGKPRPT